MLKQLNEIFGDVLANPQNLESLTGTRVLLNLTVAFICGVIIYLVYRYFNKSVVYNVRFNMLIVMVCVITSLIIITIGSNLVLTLGMVGALSIVRFRAAVKDPLDVGFLFWGVAAGLTAGAQLYAVALLGTGFIAVLYIILTITRIEKRTYLLIIRYSPDAEEVVNEMLTQYKVKIKNKTLLDSYCEVTLEVGIVKGDTSFLKTMRETDGIEGVTLVEYTGDYA
ncbi:MAG: DUF4956 domain-containing protein [Oscillospiraceae bacterium]|jgi:hypothetical protein|nr:DUF4956 domain-containing protein [Oscillospiraceae bacterium]